MTFAGRVRRLPIRWSSGRDVPFQVRSFRGGPRRAGIYCGDSGSGSPTGAAGACPERAQRAEGRLLGVAIRGLLLKPCAREEAPEGLWDRSGRVSVRQMVQQKLSRTIWAERKVEEFLSFPW